MCFSYHFNLQDFSVLRLFGYILGVFDNGQGVSNMVMTVLSFSVLPTKDTDMQTINLYFLYVTLYGRQILRATIFKRPYPTTWVGSIVLVCF